MSQANVGPADFGILGKAAASLSWFPSNLSVILWGSRHSSRWHMAENIRCGASFTTYTFTPTLTANTHTKTLLMRTFMRVNPLFFLPVNGWFSAFVLGPHVFDQALSPHTGACMGTCTLLKGPRHAACGCVGAVLVDLATHLCFFMSLFEDGFSFCLQRVLLGFLFCILCRSVCWKTAAFVPVRKRSRTLPIHAFSVALPKKNTQRSLNLSLSVYLCPWQQGPVVDIKCLCWLITHDHLNKLQNALWHFYWRQSTAKRTNVFLSGAIMTIKVSSGTWDQRLMAALRPVSATKTSLDSYRFSFFLKELIVLLRWATELTDWGRWCITAVQNN